MSTNDGLLSCVGRLLAPYGDRETSTPAEVDLDIVNIVVGIALLKPAEFSILTIRQKAGSQRA